MKHRTKRLQPFVVQLGCIGFLLAVVSVLVDVLWSQNNLAAFDADEIERGVPAFLTECMRDGEETFVGEQAEEITCRVVLLEEDAALVEVTAKQDGEALISRRALHRQAFTGKYQLAYRSIEDRELHMDVYPEGGIGYTGSTFARHYRFGYQCHRGAESRLDCADSTACMPMGVLHRDMAAVPQETKTEIIAKRAYGKAMCTLFLVLAEALC